MPRIHFYRLFIVSIAIGGSFHVTCLRHACFGQEKVAVTATAAEDSPAEKPVPATTVVPTAASATPTATPDATAAGQSKPPAQPATTTPPMGPKSVARGDRPAAPANPEELKVRPDGQGMVKFNFQGQPWLDVLEWLAKISHLSLDWQELPGDHLNLATQRAYTVEEARDVINRHLLDRGYTMLRNGEVLTVVNIKKIDPSLVQRVKPAELAKRDPHEFVKVSFSLDWMLAEQAVEELKPMISPNGKLVALKSTNRLEAMDAVLNLREIFEVLEEEQSRDGKEQLVQEFPLKFTRAADADRMLRALMGMQKNRDADGGGGGGSPNPDQFMALQQQLQQMQQQMQPQQAQPGGGQTKKEIFIVVNSKRNSLLVQAPADKMAVITQAIQRLDVGSDEPGSMLQSITNTKIYRLSEIDPTALAKILEELGNLDPTTRIKVDSKHRSLIVTGALADHLVISELIKKLDSSDRKFEVIRLRRLQADYVAGTIEFMMGGDKKESDDSMNPFMAYRFGMEFGGGGEDKKGNSKFRVSADTENNRLLLWTNDIEMKEVHNLLVKLGETPSQEGSSDRVRVIEAYDPKLAKRLADQLQLTRPELKIDVQEEPAPKTDESIPAAPDSSAPNSSVPGSPERNTSTQTSPPRSRKSMVSARAVNAKQQHKHAAGNERKLAESTRRPGQSGRILQAGRANPLLALTAIEQTVSTEITPSPDDARHTTQSTATPVSDRRAELPDGLATTQLTRKELAAGEIIPAISTDPEVAEVSEPRRVQPVFNPHRLLQPTFASEEIRLTTNADPGDGAFNSDPDRAFNRSDKTLAEDEFSNLKSRNPGANDSQAIEPIQIIVTPSGQLIIASENTQALDELEDTISQLAPPRRDFKIFHLKNRNTWPTGVVWNLEKYFGTEDKKGGGMKYSPYWGMYPSDKKDDGPNTLSKRRIPKFISDMDSHTILVTGADPEQLRIIEELINIYDQPDQSDSKALRLNRVFQLKYSKARIVADAIKEVYRDLLSANDPALQAANQNNKDQKPAAAERQYTYIYGSGEDDKDKGKEPEAPIKFKGLVSMGVDELSNTVIVSAQEGLLANIGEMIEALDDAARPTHTTVQVIRVDRHVEAAGLHERLAKILTKPQTSQPQPGQMNQNQLPGQGQPINQGGVQQSNGESSQ